MKGNLYFCPQIPNNLLGKPCLWLCCKTKKDKPLSSRNVADGAKL